MTLSLFQGEGPLSLFRIDDAQRIDATHNVSNKQLSSYYLRYCYMAIPRITPVSVGLRRALVLRESRERRAGDERASALFVLAVGRAVDRGLSSCPSDCCHRCRLLRNGVPYTILMIIGGLYNVIGTMM